MMREQKQTPPRVYLLGLAALFLTAVSMALVGLQNGYRLGVFCLAIVSTIAAAVMFVLALRRR